MTLTEASKILEASALCMRRRTSEQNDNCQDMNCDSCELLHEMGTIYERIEALELATKALKDSEPKFHLQCLRCRKDVGVYSTQTMDQVSYTHYSYCEDCLRKGLKMLKKADAEKANSPTQMSGTSDLVSRQYLLDEYDRQHQGPPGGARKIIEEAPAVVISNSDLISRQAALDVILPYCPDDDGTCSKSGDDLRNLLDDIENLPSIQSERKKGHWIEIALSNHTYKCSVCGRLLVNITDGKNNVTKNYPYCHCGADMRGDQNDDSE